MIRTRLAVQQALLVVAIAVLVSLAVLAAELVYLGQQYRDEMRAGHERLALSLNLSLANALWNYDTVAAQTILDDVLSTNAVRSLYVLDDNDQVIASAIQPPATMQATVGLVARGLTQVLDANRVQVVEVFKAGGSGPDMPVPVGAVVVNHDVNRVAARIVGELSDQALLLTAVVGCLALVLSLGFHWLISTPVLSIARAVERLDPEALHAGELTVPHFHRANEVGTLVRHINRMLGRLEGVQTELRRLATRDTLTNLPNRTLILEYVHHAIARHQESHGRCAVMFLDLDRFKHINDSMGHDAGDSALRVVGRRLQAVLNGAGAVGRLGGDEFVVVVENPEDHEALARLAARLVAALNRPMDVAGTRIHLSTSVGIACSPDDGLDGETLLRHADTAMYAAKATGPGQWRFFSEEMTHRALVRLKTEASLRSALDERAFALHYQPKYSMLDGRVHSCEALVRWVRNGEIIYPGQFIAVAEETGLIHELGRWVLIEACRQQARWARQGVDVSIAVNLSTLQLENPRFLEDFATILRTEADDPSRIQVEITESAMMGEVDSKISLLSSIRVLGVKVAIDDFGTGYSSLSYLKKLPVDILKIDRAFILDVPHDPSIATMILGLARQLGLTVVAEGVEQPDQFAWLESQGCQEIQGYLIGKAVPADIFAERFTGPISAASA